MGNYLNSSECPPNWTGKAGLDERDLKAPETIEYQLIATNATGTFQKEIDAAASQGFRFAPGTFLNKGGEVVAILAKPARVSKSYQYKMLSTGKLRHSKRNGSSPHRKRIRPWA